MASTESRGSTPDKDQHILEKDHQEADSESEKVDDAEIQLLLKDQKPPIIPGPINRCIMMIQRAKTDTEKFAALLMVTKIIKAEELDEVMKKSLLDAIGLGFLVRMLRTNETPDGCPPFMFKSIALTILTCFVSTCIRNPTLHTLIPVLSEMIAKPELYNDDLTLIKDSYHCLKTIASDKAGRKAIIDFEAVGSLVDAYIAESFCHEESLEILLLVIAEEGARTWEDEPEAFTKIMNHLTADFVADHSELKFHLCDVLAEILQSYIEVDPLNQPIWKQQLHKGLADIITSKLGRDQRDKGLRLAGVALEMLGVSWVVGDESETRGRQLLLVMVHLACIEVRMSLEDKSSQEAVALALPTTACYTILELAINFLVSGAVDFEQKQKQQLYAALKGAFNAVLSFLSEVSADELFSENPKTHLFVCATIRVLGAWLAEETAANKEEVYHVLPFIIKTCRYNFEWNNSVPTAKTKKKGSNRSQPKEDTKERLPDIFRFLLPGLCHLTAEDTPRSILLDLQLEALLFDYFNYHWSSIKFVFGPHSKVEDFEVPQEKVYNASEAMETVCNIFMNIVVQEPVRVKNDMFYYTLLKYIFGKVPDVPQENRHLRLCGNLCTLGLMVLRHQHPNVKSTDFTIYRFVQTTVRFLWDAHNVEESPDYATLVVSLRYQVVWTDLMDLWFLGINTLSLLLPSIPWLCDFLVESEWPQTIISTLVTVREGGIECGLKTAYEDLLCLLAKSSKPAYIILKEKGVEQICLNHKLEELGKVFSK